MRAQLPVTFAVAEMAWRRNKILELKDPLLFKQEYPATAAEAFQMTGHDSFIPPILVVKARNNSAQPSGPLVIGFDPAWTGDARHVMAWRRGRKVLKVESCTGLDTMQSAGWLKQVIDRHRLDSRAALASFTLGRVELEQLGSAAEAAAAFAGARRLAPEGPLAQDALAREVEAWARAGDISQARRRAREFLQLYPGSRRESSVRRHAQLD